MSPLLAVMLTAHTLTILGIHIAHLVYIKAILIAHRDHPQQGLVPRPAAATLANHGDE